MPLTTDEKLELLRVIGHGRLQADSYVDTVGDAVLIAVNQVQDTRIDLAVLAQSASSTDRVLQLLLGIALQASGGVLMKTLTRSFVERLTKSRLLVGNISPKVAGGLKTTSQVNDLGVYRRQKVNIDEVFGYIDAERLDQPFIEHWSYGLLTVYKQAAGTVNIPKGSLKRPNPLADRLTPGASILKSALEWRTEQMALNTFTFENLQTFVLLDLVKDVSHAEQILEELRAFQTPLAYKSAKHPLTLGEIRNLYIEFFEFSIWALFIVPAIRGRGSPAEPYYTNYGPRLRVFESEAADIQLTHYLLRTQHPEAYDEARGKKNLENYVRGRLPRIWADLVKRYSAAKRLERQLGSVDITGKRH